MTYSRNSLWTEPDPDGIDGATMDAWLRARGPSGAQFVGLPYREPPVGTGQAVIDECKPYGINPVLKMSQIAHETANLQSHIVRDKNNPSGIGAVNDNAYEGAHTYETLQEGIRASVAHLMGYLAGDGPWNALSPRYELVKKAGNAGKVRTLGDLEQKWAWSPPERYNATPVDRRYGGMIAAKANDLVAFAKSYEAPKDEEPMAGDIPGVPFVAADSRHYTKGRTVTWPDLLVQHHTDGWDSLNWLTISPSSNVSSTYLLRHDGTIRAQLVRHADTPHTTGALNPRTLTFEWERKWPEQREVSDEQYRNIGQSWAKVVLAERARGNPNFQSDPKRSQMGGHKDYGNTTCPGNLDIDRVYREMMDALLPGSDVQPDPNSKQFETGHYIVNTTIDGTQVNFLDFYEREGGIVQLGMPMEGMWRGPDNVFRQVLENAVLELWPDGFGNVEGPVYRFGRYLDHVDRIRERLEDAA